MKLRILIYCFLFYLTFFKRYFIIRYFILAYTAFNKSRYHYIQFTK